MADKRLDATKRLSDREDLDRAKDVIHFLYAAIDFERDHSAKSVLLLLSKGMVWMVWQAGVVYFPNIAMRVEKFGNGSSILLMDLHSRDQGFYSPQDKPTIKRRSRSE